MGQVKLTFIKRKRTPPAVILLSLILYHKGLSFRQVKHVLALFRKNLSHSSIWRWLHQHGDSLKDRLWSGEMPARVVVDETMLKTSQGKVWAYIALDPKDRRLVYLDVFAHRDALRTWVFFRNMQKAYGALPRVAVVDGGKWYIEPLKQFDIKRVVMRYGVRNYVERFFKTLERRWKDFDGFFSCRDGPGYPPYWHWLLVFAWHYNSDRGFLMA